MAPAALAEVIPLSSSELVFGRRPGPGGARLDDPTVSRRHFAIRWDEQERTHLGRDLSSRNGSRVGGLRLEPEGAPQPLSDGDVVRIGDVLLVYETVISEGPSGERAEVSRDAIPGEAAATQRLRSAVAAAAADPSPVLLVGETGTGKEYVAREIHRLSGRKGPLVAVNCAALSPQLIESQLFGHRRGAFTGAQEDREGLFRAAQGGTIFLDEIGDLPLALQPKLLRVLQEREVLPVGETRSVPIDVRVVSATLQDLTAQVDDGRFRLDLYARLSPWEIRVPALRERRADLLIWVERLLSDWYRRRERGPSAARPELDADVIERLLLHDWRDNLRGLDRWVHRLATDPSSALALSPDAGEPRPSQPRSAPPRGVGGDDRHEPSSPDARPAKPTRAELERVLRQHDGSVRATARHYDRDRRQIYRWMDQLGLRGEGDED